jgi:CTP synthase
MQMAVIEYARNVLHLENANSTEMDPYTPHPVIDLMEEQKLVTEKGGTMRLGSWDCKILKESKSYLAYGTELISERHRHRFEFNNDYFDQITKSGLEAMGVNPDTGLVEIIELKDHPWFIGVQFHPEYKSTVLNPHPLFLNFIKACKLNK